jgi:RNA polymerase sigma-70 factor (ECF subfamily)
MLPSPSRRRGRQLDRFAARAQGGDGRAFAALYRGLHPAVMRFLTRRLRDSSQAEELCALTFERVVARLDSFDASKGCIEAWVIRISRNALIDHLRAQRPRANESELALLAEQGDDPLERVLEGERMRHLGELLAACSAQERELLALRYGDGLRHRAIAELLGISEAAVRKRLSRAVGQLRERSRDHAKRLSAKHPDKEVGYVY